MRSVLIINAHIVTMDANSSTADAMLMTGRKLIAVGTQTSISANLPPFTRVLDMHGQTVLPGFIDSHSHFPTAGLSHAGLNLMPPPVGSVATLQNLLERVSDAADTLPTSDWIVGFNYDDAALDVARHPSKNELDQMAPNHPVYLWHRSGHMGVANSLALKALGYEEDASLSMSEGVAGLPHRNSNGELSGLLQEGAAPKMSFLLSQLSLTRLFRALLSARDQYSLAGITTAQNGYADVPTMRLLRWSQRLGLIPQRLVIWPAHDKVAGRLRFDLDSSSHDASEALANAIGWNQNPSRFAITAIKLIADGSPQGRTAWLTKPYLSEEEGTVSDYRGYPNVPEKEFRSLVKRYHDAGFQLAMHGNGDAAIDLIIDSVADAQTQNFRSDARHVLVHGQLIRADQLTQMAELQINATVFPSHVHFWGDWYRNNLLGEERASSISPLALAEQAGVRFSLHSDSPVTPISPMQVLWSSTTRETLSGFSLGPDMAITRERALRAMTIDAAWQSHLEHSRGSLEVGKLADFVVLSENPLTYPDVRRIRVEQLWIAGQKVDLH